MEKWNPDEELYTVAEAAAVLRCSRTSIYRYLRGDRLMGIRTPAGRILIPEWSLRAFLGQDYYQAYRQYSREGR